jgi:hypothetical protein
MLSIKAKGPTVVYEVEEVANSVDKKDDDSA